MSFRNCKICEGEIDMINETYALVKCKKCQFIFCSDVFSPEKIIATYDALYNCDDSPYQRHSKVEYELLKEGKPLKIGYNRSRLIKKYVLQDSCNSVLEIGSGVGLIGAYLKDKLKKNNYLGIEIDKVAFEESQSLNLNTIHGDFTVMHAIDQKFDVIMLWEVIEHLQDLKQFLELAYDKLEENGTLILSTPNYNRVFNYNVNNSDNIYQDSPPIHLNFFTPKSAVSVFEFSGFTRIQVNVKKYPYMELTKARFYMSSMKALIGRFYGPTLYVVAKK